MSSLMNTNAALSLTRQHFRTLGLELPGTLTATLTELDTAHARAANIRRPGALRAAVLDALIADQDPADDPTVLTELARQQLSDSYVISVLGEEIDVRRRAALDANAPAILDALKSAIVEADKVIAAAREIVGDDLMLTDPDAVSKLRPHQLTPWATAREASTRVELVMQCWLLISQSARLVSIDLNKKALILADLTAEQLDDLGYRPNPNQVIGAGHRLSLATPETYIERCNAVDQQRREAAVLREQGQRNAHKSMPAQPTAPAAA
ncbi:hypothetical protein MED01_007048 [Micromonospora sp. MED01]|uniref:hypothetical protein n=1 Tax=Micromonospora alfalfae TaxID=2911212 RepID=UPI001EE7CC77|nr:hypothetical protein [Micromonospora alfalfae]MCG5462170.1 hypothetical protein [Micromonospora alfalfae]